MIIRPGDKEKIQTIETSGGDIDLKQIKAELDTVREHSSSYFNRVSSSFDWWQSRWSGQTADGRKWATADDDSDCFPWPGASDTRVRLTKGLLNEYRTLAMHSVMNMKLSAQSVRPTNDPRGSSQATTLINWQLYSQLEEEWYRECELGLIWAGGFGASVISVDWEQARRLEMVDINVVQFGEWVSKVTGQKFDHLTFQDMLESPGTESELVIIIQEMSEIITKGQARKLLNDLRDLRFATIPVPFVFQSKPRLLALRPMIDIFFPLDTDDLQRARWIDRVERVTETVLRDRIETDNYDPKFVENAAKKRGTYSTSSMSPDSWLGRTSDGIGYDTIRPGGRGADDGDGDNLIELHHFYHYALDYGVPCLYRTVFHNDVEEFATSGLSEYDHGAMPFHALRFETDFRPILSSQGIPEITYTWENEEKAQFDARTDRSSLALSPPMFVLHSEIAKMKRAYVPNAIIPTLPGREAKFADVPGYDQGSIEISENIRRRAREYFGWFGNDLDPLLKQLRQMQLIDRVTLQFKPIVKQIFQLDQQFLPDEEVAAVVGPLARPFNVSRAEIQGQHEFTMTCDPRELDYKFIEQKADAISKILPWDQAGIIDRTFIVKRMFEAIDYTLADMAITDPQAVTAKEIEDEMAKVSLIIGSGVEQPLPPPGSNFNLRVQTLKNLLQSTPFIQTRVRQDPAVTKALENRYLYLTRQIQQQRNAQIGRDQVGSAFDHLQPAMIGQGGQGQ